MNIRPHLLVGLAALSVSAYSIKVLNQDTLPKAANRFGQAVLKSDTDTLWGFMPESERKFYRMDKFRFTKWWQSFVEPRLKNAQSYKINSVGPDGLEVIFEAAVPKSDSGRTSWLISGQLGTYYVPYMLGYSCLNAAGFDPNEVRNDKYVRFEKYVAWLDQNKRGLESLGIVKIRRGNKFKNPETLDQLRASLFNAEQVLKSRDVAP